MSEKDYICVQNFLDQETCQRLIEYFDKAIGTKKAVNVNPRFNDRVIYYEGTTDHEIKAIMKRVHEDVAKILAKFYKLEDSPIYPEATHLVKWPTGSSLGHHADNAYDPDGSPNYVYWRTHSAVVYLNHDFTGGEFYFKKELPKIIKPETGMLVAFTGGMDHVHGVQIVKSGDRYAMPMWFCQDQSRAYPEYH